MKLSHTKLSAAISAALLCQLTISQAALAEQANNKVTKEDIEKIEVKGFRASVEKSLNMKRFSDTVVDAVSAEDVGKFPDQTVADALQRIPGVSVEKDFGESDRVSIRGTAPHLNVTLLNGQNVASATASASITKPSRGFNYGLLPAELVDTLEVYKSAEADIDEGSIGGTVVVKTRKPLNTESNYAAFSLKNSYQEASGESSPIISGVYSWKNQDENFGVGLGYVYKENNIQRDSKEVRFGFRDVTLADDEVKYPGAVGYNRYQSENQLNTATVAIEYEPNDRWNFLFNNLFSSVDNKGQGSFSGSYNLSNINNIENPQVNNGTVVGGFIPDGESFEALYGSAYYEGGYDTRGHDLKTTYSGDLFTWSTQFGITKADGTVDDNYAEFYANTGVEFDLTQGSPEMALVDVGSAQDFWLGYNHLNRITNDDEEKYIQSDFEYLLDSDFFTAVKVGVKYRDHDKGSDLFKTTRPSGTQYTLDQFSNELADDFMGDSGSQDYLYMFNASAWQNHIDETAPTAAYDHLLYSYGINEKITAVYVKSDFSYEKLRGNVGVRYVKTDFETSGWEYTGAVANPTSKTRRVVENDYSDVLPSLNVNYDYSDDIIIRFGAAKVMSRPDYQHLTAQRTYSNSNGIYTGSGGNPDVDPYRANQFDLSAEWYFGSSSILSMALFYKDIESYITEDYVIESLPDDEGEYHDYEIKVPVNGLGGVNQGVELNLQHDFDNGFGMLANYTYSDADLEETAEQIAAGETSVLPNNSRHTYNLTGYYEQDAISARLSYNYRSEYYFGSYQGLSQYMNGFGQLDANITYSVNDNTSLLLQVVNLTDNEQEKDYDDVNRPIGTFSFGRRWLAGVQVKF